MKTGFILGAFLILAAGSQAGVINVSSAKNNTNAVTDAGSITAITTVADNSSGASPGQDLIYEISDLNLDGGPTANDKVAVRFKVTASGNIQTSAAAGWLSSPGNLLAADGDWLKLENVGVDVYLDGVLDAGATAASSMTALSVKMAGWAIGEAGTINGTFREATTANETFSSADNKTISLEWIAADGAAGSWRFLDMNYSVNVVPEPATLGLIASFGGGILFVRRRISM